MRVLIACEYSGTVRRAFRARGHDAWSCDIEPSIDASPFHRQEDYRIAIAEGWDMVVAHPPCTHLAASGAKHWAKKRADGRQDQGINFFMGLQLRCEIYSKHWAIENPVGIMSSEWRKPDQIIQPWHFGDEARKTTCLWLSPSLPLLKPDCIVGHGRLIQNPDGRMMPAWYTTKGKHRSVTFPGIARAMAEQWSKHASST